MQRPLFRLPILSLAAGIALLASGCATTRSTFDILPARAEAAAPAAVVYVKFTGVADKRTFEEKPVAPSIPSLASAEDLRDPAIKARAIARKRGGFGAAMADILLPPDRTVAQVVTEAITDALRQQGYAVVDAGSPQYTTAIPLSVDIQQFWSWFTPGFWTISIENESIVVLKSQPLFPSGEETVRGYAVVNSMAATDGEWQRTMQLGVKDLVDKTKARIAKAQSLKQSAR